MPKHAKQARSTKTAKSIWHVSDTVIRDSVVPELARRVRGNSAKLIVYWKQDGRHRKTTLGAVQPC